MPKDGVVPLKPYKDSKGILTIGIGHNLEQGISKGAAYYLLHEDLETSSLISITGFRGGKSSMK
jgi:GH24 family phage-related lysozyme (muramidase)